MVFDWARRRWLWGVGRARVRCGSGSEVDGRASGRSGFSLFQIQLWILCYNYMNRSRTKKGKGSQIPLFISKLLQMVENRQLQPILNWTSTSDSFNIKNISKFTQQVLPRYFKHRNFSSFIRQLNMYGFRKIRHSDGQNVYQHEHFRSGSRAQLKHINRKMREEREERLLLYQAGGQRQQVPGKELNELKTRQKNLEQMCRHFFNQNQKLMEQNQTIIKRMQQQNRERDRRLQDFLIQLTQVRMQPQLSNQPINLSITETMNTASISAGQQSNQTEQFKRIKTLLQNLYAPTSASSQFPNEQEKEESSFLSINDFINADDYEEGLNLQQSR